MTRSIGARLSLWYIGLVTGVLAAAAIAAALSQERLGLRGLDEEIDRLSMTLEGVMRTEINEGLTLTASAEEASIEVVAPDRTMMLLRPDGRVLQSWGRALPAPWQPLPGRPDGAEPIVLAGVPLRVLNRHVDFGGFRYQYAILATLDGVNRERTELLTALAVGGAVGLALAAVGGWLVARRALRPLSDMATQAISISAQGPVQHLVTPNNEDELGRLGAAFNALLDRLAAALKSQRQFMADASHELRTPVSVVRTTAQVMLGQPHRPEDDYRDSLGVVAEQSGRLARLVDAMFLLSRAEASGLPLRHEHVYLDDLVSDSVRALRVVAEERGVDIRSAGASEVRFTGDDALLRQMFGNLLDNAVRHTPSGGSVVAELERVDGHAYLRIVDQGPGIPPAERERIFDRFVRLDMGSGGAGLGLPIARWIAESHGGTLIVERSGPEGTCFTVTLPLPPSPL